LAIEHDHEWHARVAELAVLAHDDVGVRRDEARQPGAGPADDGAGVRGVVKARFRVHHDVHRGDVGRGLLLAVDGNRQLRPVHFVTLELLFLHRPVADVHETARWQAQPVGEGAKIVLARDPEGTRLQLAVLHQNVAQAKAGLLDDILEEHGVVALRRERRDVLQAHRLRDPGDDVGVGREIAPQVLVERPGGRVRRCSVADRKTGAFHEVPPGDGTL
jgi:hypothetical protein